MTYIQGLCVCLLFVSTLLADCPYKKCSCGVTDIMCNNLKLTAIPEMIIKNNTFFTNAQFDINEISTIPAGSFPGNLSQISFTENPLVSMDDNAFQGLENTLLSFSFSQAKFLKFPDAFGRLNTLRFLSVSESVIQVWNDGVMQHIGASLNSLSIENINLKTWPDWLKYFTNLTELSISGASIADIPDGSFNSLTNVLIDLSLYNNSLTTIPKAISTLSSLQSLALDHNKITDITWLPQTIAIKSLALNNNKIHDSNQLSTLLRVHANTLVDLDIRDNLLTSFPDFDFLIKIWGFDFNKNKLADPNSGSLPSTINELKLEHNSLPRIPRVLTKLIAITQLFMSTNAITALEASAFPPAVRGVELDHNLIQELTDDSFPQNANITYIVLSSNPLIRISDNAFKYLPHLVELQLQSTKLTRLPLALVELPRIDVFDISGTTTLLCTCLEKSLQKWILSLAPDKVIGTCGEASVQYFYKYLSSDCP